MFFIDNVRWREASFCITTAPQRLLYSDQGVAYSPKLKLTQPLGSMHPTAYCVHRTFFWMFRLLLQSVSLPLCQSMPATR